MKNIDHKKDLKKHYEVNIRISAIVALLSFISLFILAPGKFKIKPYEVRKEVITISEQLPDVLENLQEPPTVKRPEILVAANNNEGVNTIPDTDTFNYHAPTDVTIPVVKYYQLQVKPKPLYTPSPSYPVLAKKAGIEGRVVVKVLLDIDGKVIDVKILKSSGNPLLDNSALNTAYKWRFTPAEQRDRKVRVWITIPFDFRIE